MDAGECFCAHSGQSSVGEPQIRKAVLIHFKTCPPNSPCPLSDRSGHQDGTAFRGSLGQNSANPRRGL
jgi:hypothetical protein